MGYLELLLIGVGLAMDAFAVSICKGLNMKVVNKKHCFMIALFFGGFQALMPLIGWLPEYSLNIILKRLTTGSHLFFWL